MGIRARGGVEESKRSTLARPGTQRAQEERKRRIEDVWAEMQQAEKTDVGAAMGSAAGGGKKVTGAHSSLALYLWRTKPLIPPFLCRLAPRRRTGS